MKKQLQSIGLSLDWSREFATCDPGYYKHQQKLFLDFLRAGLVEREKRKVNWDPVDMTVLANEQVIDGRGWRSGAVVEQRELNQWVFKITELLAGAAGRARHAGPLARQGAADAAQLDRPLRGPAGALRARSGDRAGRRERAEDLHDAARHAVRRQVHGDRRRSSAGAGGWRRRIRSSPSSSPSAKRIGTAQAIIDTAEKQGFDTGIRAIHPFDPNWKLPVYVANFVLMDYGTGAIFGCPAHDQRDLDFANKYGLGNTPVVCRRRPGPERPSSITDAAYDGDGRMINSRFLDGMTIEAGQGRRREAARARAARQQPVGERQVNFRLRDWGISRQRYWGCPIPVIHCATCGVVPVPDQDLPVMLPEDVTFDKPGNPLDHHPTWKHVTCPQCGGKAHARDRHAWTRSSNSSWYFARFTDPLERERADRRLTSADRTGCRSTSISAASSTRSCICSTRRFFTRAHEGHRPYRHVDEPFAGMFTQGMVVHETYQKADGSWVDAGRGQDRDRRQRPPRQPG